MKTPSPSPWAAADESLHRQTKKKQRIKREGNTASQSLSRGHFEASFYGTDSSPEEKKSSAKKTLEEKIREACRPAPPTLRGSSLGKRRPRGYWNPMQASTTY
jgi:hypothetical protein